MPFGQQSCIIRLNKKWTGRENSVSGVLCEVKNKEICCSEIQKTVGMTGFFKKSYKNIRTKKEEALCASSFLVHRKIGLELLNARVRWTLARRRPRRRRHHNVTSPFRCTPKEKTPSCNESRCRALQVPSIQTSRCPHHRYLLFLFLRNFIKP